jgi:hypothetical protein
VLPKTHIPSHTGRGQGVRRPFSTNILSLTGHGMYSIPFDYFNSQIELRGEIIMNGSILYIELFGNVGVAESIVTNGFYQFIGYVDYFCSRIIHAARVYIFYLVVSIFGK